MKGTLNSIQSRVGGIAIARISTKNGLAFSICSSTFLPPVGCENHTTVDLFAASTDIPQLNNAHFSETRDLYPNVPIECIVEIVDANGGMDTP